MLDQWLKRIALENETWVEAPGIPEYMVSNLGRVMRKPTFKLMPHGGFRVYGGKPWYGTGRDRLKFMYKGKNYIISRLVCIAFNGPPPFYNAYVLHDDENAKNNKATNLVWGTQKQNLNYPGFITYCKNRRWKSKLK